MDEPRGKHGPLRPHGLAYVLGLLEAITEFGGGIGLILGLFFRLVLRILVVMVVAASNPIAVGEGPLACHRDGPGVRDTSANRPVPLQRRPVFRFV